MGKLGHVDAARPIAAFLDELVTSGPENPEIVRGYQSQEETFVWNFEKLIRALSLLDKTAANAIAVRILSEGPELLKPAALRIWNGVPDGKR